MLPASLEEIPRGTSLSVDGCSLGDTREKLLVLSGAHGNDTVIKDRK